MPDIFHQFPVFAPVSEVFKAVSTPEGLDAWWTLSSKGEPVAGNIYELFFGEGYDWRARVSTCVAGKIIAFSIYDSLPDWENSIVRFELTEESSSSSDGETSAISASSAAITQVRFSHTGWREENDHYRISSFCWAMYLRLLKKYCEEGTVVEYAKRLDA
jgi:uncharacterized protein YndB with AHSA1/START domain